MEIDRDKQSAEEKLEKTRKQEEYLNLKQKAEELCDLLLKSKDEKKRIVEKNQLLNKYTQFFYLNKINNFIF